MAGLLTGESASLSQESRMSDGSERQYLDDVPRELQDLLYEGKKIAAIKYARETMGCGLKDGKEAIETIEARMREQFPDALPAAQGTGCGAAMLFLAVLIAVCGYLLS
jgi:ribosomal protein L7/L12